MSGTAFGDIAFVSTPFEVSKESDIEEWYISTVIAAIMCIKF